MIDVHIHMMLTYEDHLKSDSIFDRSTSVEEFTFDQDLCFGLVSVGYRVQLHKGCLADAGED